MESQSIDLDCRRGRDEICQATDVRSKPTTIGPSLAGKNFFDAEFDPAVASSRNLPDAFGSRVDDPVSIWRPPKRTDRTVDVLQFWDWPRRTPYVVDHIHAHSVAIPTVEKAQLFPAAAASPRRAEPPRFSDSSAGWHRFHPDRTPRAAIRPCGSTRKRRARRSANCTGNASYGKRRSPGQPGGQLSRPPTVRRDEYRRPPCVL